MIRKYIFYEENISLFAPSSNEFLYNFIYQLGYKDEDANDWKARFIVLSVIKELFELRVLSVHSWCNDEKLNNENLSIDEIINRIDYLWKKNTKYPDYYNMLVFGTQKWYIDKLRSLGMTNTTDWNSFVEKKIGNLEKWIELNKPK